MGSESKPGSSLETFREIGEAASIHTSIMPISGASASYKLGFYVRSPSELERLVAAARVHDHEVFEYSTGFWSLR